jgi:RsiW-degrading membrane proteinase PrsW (M82 family)
MGPDLSNGHSERWMIANLFVLLLLAVAPSAVLLKYVLLRDKYAHEPMRLIAITFLFGALSIIPATILEILLNSPNILINAFLVTALIEESMKYLAVRAKAYHSPNFNEVMDGIVYGVAAGLGFATVENLFYVFGFGTISTAIIRAFLSVPSHAAYAGIMGFYLGMAKANSQTMKKREKTLIVTGLAIAITLHGLYDTVAFALEGVAGLVALVGMTLISWLILLHLIKKALTLSPVRWKSPTGFLSYPFRFCTQCGIQREPGSRYCVGCGQRFEN